MLKYFSKYPLLIFLVPVALGIIISEAQLGLYFFVPLFLILIFFTILINSKRLTTQKKWTFAILTFLLIISYCNSEADKLHKQNIPKGELAFFRVDEYFHKDTNTKLLGELLSNDKFDSEGVLLYIEGNNYNLKPGTVISFYTDFTEIRNLGNPCEFDYSGYMKINGIIHEQFLEREQYNIVGESMTIFNHATRIRNSLINKVFNSDISIGAQDFLVAILLGDKRYLDSDLKDSFSKVGIAHILALSGLHIGIIGLIVYFLLVPLNYLGLRNYRLIISIVILFIYSFITGCSPSVLRALLMYVFASVSIIIYRKNNVINSIAGAAILILLISPIQLYDIGFQLSFLAVMSIILFTPMLNPLNNNNRYYSAINYLMVPAAAMLGTGVLSVYYFKVAPILFIIPNLIIVPLLPILLFAGILILLTDIQILNYVFELLYQIIISVTDLVGNLSCSNYIVHINITQCVLLYLSIILLFFGLKYKRLKKYIMLVILTSLICVYFSKDDINRFNIIIFNDYKETPILLNDANDYTMVPIIDEEYLMSFQKHNKAFLSKYSIPEITLNEKFSEIDRIYKFKIMSNNFVVLDSTLPRTALSPEDRCNVQYLVVTKNCFSSISTIIGLFNPKCIILSGNIYNDRRQDLIKSCQDYGVPYHDIRDKGAFVLN